MLGAYSNLSSKFLISFRTFNIHVESINNDSDTGENTPPN